MMKNYSLRRNNGLLQYPYSVIHRKTGRVIDNCNTLVGCLVVIYKHKKQASTRPDEAKS